MDLKEQKECSNHQGTIFAGKRSIIEVPPGCCPRAALSRHPLCYYNSVPFSLFCIFTELSNRQDFCQLPKSPQATLLYFLLQTQYSFTGRNSSFLQPFQLHKPAAHLWTYKTSSLTMGCSLLPAFHPSPGSALHPWWITFDHTSHCGYSYTLTDKIQLLYTMWVLSNTPAGPNSACTSCHWDQYFI